ncbi:MAG: V-type ATP synthase subunit A, partial [Rectinema sp.]|nr:V-type ATP synthase subunit A [Rectinema sp.]
MTTGKVTAVNGNMVSIDADGIVTMNEVAYIASGSRELKSEVIRIRGNSVQVQVYEITRGIKIGDAVRFTGELLSVELGPGLLGQIYDGLQNPLPGIAEKTGYFLEPGLYLKALSRNAKWHFTPSVKLGDILKAGMSVGWVPELHFRHQIMIPFDFAGEWKIVSIAEEGDYTIEQVIAEVEDNRGARREVRMSFSWPVKRAVRCYAERLKPETPLVTKTRIIDTFFPVAKGGTYCIPGPFGAGKTVLQQVTSRNAEVDIVLIAACGERAGEVVETLKEFPEIIDPKTGRSLMERTVIICNTSSMPVAAREASVYTAVTIAEYYRQMGLDVLLLADSTSRWAQAMREMSGRLEEIPGEEAFPAYLESVIAAFYERAGIVRLYNG